MLNIATPGPVRVGLGRARPWLGRARALLDLRWGWPHTLHKASPAFLPPAGPCTHESSGPCIHGASEVGKKTETFSLMQPEIQGSVFQRGSDCSEFRDGSCAPMVPLLVSLGWRGPSFTVEGWEPPGRWLPPVQRAFKATFDQKRALFESTAQRACASAGLGGAPGVGSG